MDWSSQFFILAIIGMSTLGWIVTTAIRAKHGYPVTDDWGKTIGQTAPDTDRRLVHLDSENERLRGQVLRMEERISVLERLATDDGARLGREIDALR